MQNTIFQRVISKCKKEKNEIKKLNRKSPSPLPPPFTILIP